MALYPQPIHDNAIDLTPTLPEFQRHFANIVGNAASDSDGFETLFAPVADHVAGASGFLIGFDSDLNDIGALPVELDGRFHRDFADSLANTIQSGQGAFDSFALHLTGNNPPAAQPSGPPVQGGGGLQPVSFGTLIVGSAPRTIAVPFVNPFAHDIHPTGVTVNQGRLIVFVADSQCGATIPANGTCNILVTFRPLLVGHYAGLLVFNTDDTNSPYTLGISGTVIAAPIVSGGGGGGGGGVGRLPFPIEAPPAGGGFGGGCDPAVDECKL